MFNCVEHLRIYDAIFFAEKQAEAMQAKNVVSPGQARSCRASSGDICAVR